MTLHRMDSLVVQLDQKGLGYEVSGDHLVVHADLCCDAMPALPRQLTVHGWFSCGNNFTGCLPDRLHVSGGVFLSSPVIAALPREMCVGGGITLADSSITYLPPNLRVRGDLNLSDTPIRVLPLGLHVDGNLRLTNTCVVVLPHDLSVGGPIIPPDGLQDITAFMQDREDVVTLSLDGSRHARLRVQDSLQNFPDLWRVLCSHGDGYKITLRRRRPGKYTVQAEFQHW